MNVSGWLTVLVLGVAVWWAWPAPPRTLADLERAPRRRRWTRLAPAVGVVAGAPVVLGLRWSLWLVAAVVLAATGWRLVWAWRTRTATERVRREVAEGCQVVASQLQVGVVATQALAVAAADCPVLEPVRATQAVGGDVVAALRQASAQPGAEGLADLAAAWALASRSGAPVADIAAQVARELAESERLRRLVDGELAAPRASGKLLGLLPLVGLAMAGMVGAEPGELLLGTWFGQVCLVAAVGLSCAGVLWTEHLADRASEVAAR